MLDRQTVEPYRITPVCYGDLAEANQSLHPPVIHCLARRGETVNIVAPPKRGKSWLVNHLGLSVVAGQRFLDTFDCERGRVLIIDNELHAPIIAHRIQTVADAMALQPAD